MCAGLDIKCYIVEMLVLKIQFLDRYYKIYPHKVNTISILFCIPYIQMNPLNNSVIIWNTFGKNKQNIM